MLRSSMSARKFPQKNPERPALPMTSEVVLIAMRRPKSGKIAQFLTYILIALSSSEWVSSKMDASPIGDGPHHSTGKFLPFVGNGIPLGHSLFASEGLCNF